MAGPCLIYDDPRLIDGIFYPGEDAGCYRAGQGLVTKIVAYREHGQGDFVPYYAVYHGEEIAARVPAHLVEVTYARTAITQAEKLDGGVG